MLRGTPEIIWILWSNIKLARYSRRMKPPGQTLQSNQSQHAASSRMKPQSWTLQWEHQNAIPSQTKKPNTAETQVSMIFTQNETTKPNTAEELTFACNANKMKPHQWTPIHTSSQAQTRIIHIWYQICWHCSYSNITCLPLFTVQSTLWQNCHTYILYTSYSIHTIPQKRWPLSGCCTPKDQRNEVVSFWTCRCRW